MRPYVGSRARGSVAERKGARPNGFDRPERVTNDEGGGTGVDQGYDSPPSAVMGFLSNPGRHSTVEDGRFL